MPQTYCALNWSTYFFFPNLTHFLWFLYGSWFWLDHRSGFMSSWLITVEPCSIWWIFVPFSYNFLFSLVLNVLHIWHCSFVFSFLIFLMCVSLVHLQTIPCSNYFLYVTLQLFDTFFFFLEITFLEGSVLLYSERWYYIPSVQLPFWDILLLSSWVFLLFFSWV